MRLFAADGQLDGTFSSDGKQTVPFDLGGTLDDMAADVAVGPDGRIVVVGKAVFSSSGEQVIDTDFAITRLLPNGSPDTSFAGDGSGSYAFDKGPTTDLDSAQSVVVLDDGSIVACGTADAPTERDLALLKVLPGGAVDPAVGTVDFPGKVLLDLAPYRVDTCNLVRSRTGRILATISTSIPAGGVGPSGIFSLSPVDLQYDTNFGAFGFSEQFEDCGGFVGAKCIFYETIELSDGHLLAGGRAAALPLVARFTADGDRDLGWGTNGMLTFEPPGSWSSARVEQLGRQRDGRVILFTYATETLQHVGRLDDDGIDASFGSEGWRQVESDIGGLGEAYLMEVQSDDKIVIVGAEYQQGLGANFAMSRWLASGSGIDSSFGVGGYSVVEFDIGGANDDFPRGATLDGGRLVAVGENGTALDDDFAIARLQSALVFTNNFEDGSTTFWSSKVP